MGNSEWGSEKPFKKKICCEKKMYLEKEPEGCKMSAISLGPWARGRGHGAETHLRPVPRTRVRLCSAECDIVLFLSVLLSGAMTRLAALRGPRCRCLQTGRRGSARATRRSALRRHVGRRGH